MRRPAIYAGLATFVLVELIVVFGSAIVASVRCCATVGPVGPADAGDWATLAIFAIVMTVPAALIALGVAIVVDVCARAVTASRARRAPDRSVSRRP